MEPISIAVISDLHVGKSARSKDLCPHEESKAIESDFRSNFIAFLERASIAADYILIPGDITDGADPDEFKLASDFITDIARKLNVEDEKIIFVPGNHDVNWPLLKINPKDQSGVYYRLRYAPLVNEDAVFHKIIQNCKQKLLDTPYIGVWEFTDLLVVGINSSWHDDPSIAIHHGIVSNETIDELRKILEGLDLEQQRLKVFLVHHHPIPYSDPLPSLPDFSIMTNAPALLQLLQSHQFDLLVHGHKHVPNLITYSVNSSFPILILASGSLSSVLDTRWSGCVNNQFHIVKIDGRDTSDKTTFGNVESWSYTTASGWTKSKEHNGISHVIPFGTYVHPNVLSEQLREIIQKAFKAHQYIRWSDVTKDNQTYQFLPPSLLIDVLDKLAVSVGFKRHGAPPDEIILLKDGAYHE
jgi:3',5'-cyclic AMP phosphodiesterase CpdA